MQLQTLDRLPAKPRRLAVLAALLAFGSLNAHAGDSKMVQQVKDYAAKNNLKIRKVMAPGPGKPVERLFVPVLPHTFDDLSNRLVEANGGIGIRALAQEHDAYGHMAISIEPGSTYLWAKPQADMYKSLYMSHQSGGYLFGVDLSSEELGHFKKQIATIPHCAGNCMMWIGEAEIAPGKFFMHGLGVTRSKGAGNAMRQKFLRVANERLKVAGVVVNSVEEFEQLTDAQLLGPPHPNGDAESIHE